MRQVLGGLFLWLGICATARADETTVQRYLEFRDGSILRMPVVDETRKVTVVRPNGRIETTPLRLSSLQNLTLTSEEGFARKQVMLSAVRQLASNTFEEREDAQARLVKMGPAIRQDLQACLRLSTDPETQARLRTILGQLPMDPSDSAKTTISFDLFQVNDQPLWGDVGGDGIPVLLDGVKHRLTRKDVLAMTQANPVKAANKITAALAGFERIGPKDFPPGCTEEGFETTPDGRPLRIGENIERLFISKGFLLSTSISTSWVSVNNFVVEGKSRGLSAATHQPLWEGEITIKFVKPGHETVAAGVTHFGCYIAAVVPQGTSLMAYDLQGRELGTIHTERSGVDFLGVRSSVPMHRIKIVPNPSLDRDYTLDDFIFTPPRTSESLHPAKFTVYLTEGDRVVCSDVSFGKMGVQLHGLPAGLPERTYQLAQVLRIAAPNLGRPELPPPAGVFAELRDGSVILGTAPADNQGQPVFARRPQTLQEKGNLAGLWSSDFPRLVPQGKTGKTAVWDADQKQWQDLSYVRLLEEIVLWKGADGTFDSRPYRKLGPLWLAAPALRPRAGSWHVRTVQGEDLVLNTTAGLTGRLSQELNAMWQGQTLRIPAAEVVAIFQVPNP
jgi:hypothetical protein